jgi:glycosyltransferase involved in cell wall biosynthesis
VVIVAPRAIDPGLAADYEAAAELFLLPTLPAPLLAPRLARLIRADRASLVHAHLGRATIASSLAALMAGVPLVVTFHLMHLAHTTRQPGGPGAAVYRALLRRARRTIAVSEAVRQATMADGLLPIEAIDVVHNGVADRPPAGPRPGPEAGVLYVGRLAPDKSVDHLIRAVAEARTQPSLRIAGTGPDAARLKALAAVLLPGRHEFAGFSNSPEDLYEGCAVVAIPGVEGFGLVAVEAMRAGRVVIGTTAGALPEIVVDGETGLLARPGDVGDLASKLDRVLTDRSAAAEMEQRGRRRFEACFTAARMAERTEAVYVRALTRGAATT